MDGPSNPTRQLSLLALSFAGLGALSILGGAALALFGVLGGAALFVGGSWSGGASFSMLMVIAGVGVALSGVPEIAAWVGLTRRRPWGRLLAIVLCTAGLAAFPFGTAFGAWGLWVLMTPASLALFGIERSWVADGGAVLLGWMLQPDRPRETRSQRRRYRARRGGGMGCLFFVVVIVGLLLFASCAEILSGVAGRVSGGSHGFEHLTPRAQLEDFLDERSQMSTGAPTPPASSALPVEPVAPVAPVAPTAVPATAPPAPVPAPGRGRAVYLYTAADGSPVIVDDLEKVPASRRHTVRQP